MELKIHGLSKRYPNGVQALNQVSLVIPTGMFGLLGPNGAGKSTLMRTLATLQEADSGTAFLDDLDVLRNKPQVRRILGYLPQEFGVYPKVSAWDLLDHLATLKGIGSRRHRKEVVGALLKKVNLWDVRRQKLGGFSGGMKQRFGIAQALLGEPKLIIVDEPTAGLDPEERVRFLNFLSEIGEQVIVILSTHIVDDVNDLCQRMAVIHGGEVVTTGDPGELSRRLNGKIWRKAVDRGNLPQLASGQFLISTQLRAGKTIVRVYADEAPDPDFIAVEPELEDVYFHAIKVRPQMSATGQAA
jgi:ABC-2 type transport system ATP-binding protein